MRAVDRFMELQQDEAALAPAGQGAAEALTNPVDFPFRLVQ